MPGRCSAAAAMLVAPLLAAEGMAASTDWELVNQDGVRFSLYLVARGRKTRAA